MSSIYVRTFVSGFILCWSATGMALDFPLCQFKLKSAGELSARSAADYCLKNSTEAFVSCQFKLRSSGELRAESAAEYCLRNSSPEFVSCQFKLRSSGELSPRAAADYCLRDSSPEFVSCQFKLRSAGGLRPISAADYCMMSLRQGEMAKKTLASSSGRNVSGQVSDVVAKCTPDSIAGAGKMPSGRAAQGR